MRNLTIALSINILFGCTPPQLDPKEYIAWVENPENGLRIQKELDNHVLELFYEPLPYKILKERGTLEIDTTFFNSRKKAIGGLQYMTLKIADRRRNKSLRTSVDDDHNYIDVIDYYLKRAKEDIFLYEDNDTLKCVLYHFESNHGIKPYNNILLAFENNEGRNSKHDKTLIFSNPLFKKGSTSITISKSDLKKLPSINIF